MTFALVLIPTACYGLASIIYAVKGNAALGVVYFGYMIANCGLLAIDRMQK
jgi:hypothetical protein